MIAYYTGWSLAVVIVAVFVGCLLAGYILGRQDGE